MQKLKKNPESMPELMKAAEEVVAAKMKKNMLAGGLGIGKDGDDELLDADGSDGEEEERRKQRKREKKKRNEEIVRLEMREEELSLEDSMYLRRLKRQKDDEYKLKKEKSLAGGLEWNDENR